MATSDRVSVMRGYAITLINIILTLASMSWASSDAPTGATEPTAPLYPADLLQISSTDAFSKYVMLVDKGSRKLMVFERDGETIRLLEEVPADIGKKGGNKERENDHRTPEGIYFFQEKLASPAIPFNLYGKMAFTTDYPNVFDRRLKKTGHGIWLHSIPETVPLTRGSRGCVVIRNEALARVENYIKMKQTPIIIYDKLEYVTKAEHDHRRTELAQWIEGWRQAWESKDTEKYLSFYSPDFSAPGFKDFGRWEKHKARLAKNYADIKVSFSQPFLLRHKDQLIIKTLQKYQSDQYTDYGVKVIHAVRTDSGYKIIREEWTKADERGEESPALISEHPNAASPHPN
ncbi:MAG: L,D-transpeptidase family protein [Bdellovibrionaceae bacterium]|nr:L,D-transpeptidase family protein [Pseudobdellovibrionaceae bacterium]